MLRSHWDRIRRYNNYSLYCKLQMYINIDILRRSLNNMYNIGYDIRSYALIKHVIPVKKRRR